MSKPDPFLLKNIEVGSWAKSSQNIDFVKQLTVLNIDFG